MGLSGELVRITTLPVRGLASEMISGAACRPYWNDEGCPAEGREGNDAFSDDASGLTEEDTAVGSEDNDCEILL
jgi:hypothetical protein